MGNNCNSKRNTENYVEHLNNMQIHQINRQERSSGKDTSFNDNIENHRNNSCCNNNLKSVGFNSMDPNLDDYLGITKTTTMTPIEVYGDRAPELNYNGTMLDHPQSLLHSNSRVVGSRVYHGLYLAYPDEMPIYRKLNQRM